MATTAGARGRNSDGLGAKVLLGKPHAEPEDQLGPLRPVLGVAYQEDFDVPHSHCQDRRQPGALGGQQEEEEFAKDALLAKVEGLLRGADRLLDLVLEIIYRHGAVLPAFVRQVELFANLAETVEDLRAIEESVYCHMYSPLENETEATPERHE